MSIIRTFAEPAAVIALALATGGPAAAQDVRSLAPGAAPAPATLADFTGLVGEWAGPLGVAGFSPPAGGQIVGHLALLANPSTPRIEELWIYRPEGGSVVLRQKHFNADLSGREEKDAWSQRKLVAVAPGHIFLENLTWTLHGQTLDLNVRLPGANGAPPTVISYSFQKVK